MAAFLIRSVVAGLLLLSVVGTDGGQRACLRGVVLPEHARDMAGAVQHWQHSSGRGGFRFCSECCSPFGGHGSTFFFLFRFCPIAPLVMVRASLMMEGSDPKTIR